jgi:pantothenate synthetase
LNSILLFHLECDVVIASIFVNPTQFAPHEDLAIYPRSVQQQSVHILLNWFETLILRDLDRDIRLLTEGGCDILFAPSSVEELYPNGYRTFVTLNGIENTLEGKSRPGHFKGPFLQVENPKTLYVRVQGILISKLQYICLFCTTFYHILTT